MRRAAFPDPPARARHPGALADHRGRRSRCSSLPRATSRRSLAGRQATPETIALIKHRLGLDLPIWKQYLNFVENALHGNLGYDYYHQVPVTHDHRPGAADHGVAGARRRRAVAAARGVQRRDLGHAPALAGRSRSDRCSRCSSTRSRRSCSGCCCCTSCTSGSRWPASTGSRPGGYIAAHRRGSAPWVAASGAALDRTRSVAGGDVHAADPRFDARRARRGLHPHRAVEGHPREPSDRPARPAQRADAGGDPVRHRPRAS